MCEMSRSCLLSKANISHEETFKHEHAWLHDQIADEISLGRDEKWEMFAGKFK